MRSQEISTLLSAELIRVGRTLVLVTYWIYKREHMFVAEAPRLKPADPAQTR